MAAISTLVINQIRVPEDISIVGYDDYDMAAFTSPSLTTIRVSHLMIWHWLL